MVFLTTKKYRQFVIINILVFLRHLKWSFCAKKTKYIFWEHRGEREKK